MTLCSQLANQEHNVEPDERLVLLYEGWSGTGGCLRAEMVGSWSLVSVICGLIAQDPGKKMATDAHSRTYSIHTHLLDSFLC